MAGAEGFACKMEATARSRGEQSRKKSGELTWTKEGKGTDGKLAVIPGVGVGIDVLRFEKIISDVVHLGQVTEGDLHQVLSTGVSVHVRAEAG